MIRAWLQLIRPLNFVMALAGVLLGAILGQGAGALREAYLTDLLLAALSAALIGGGANALNDYLDREIDAVSHPDRPLPSGKLPPGVALWTGWGLLLMGWGLAFALTPFHRWVATAALAAILIYNYRLKHLPLVGNLLVAAVVAMSLYYGAAVVGHPLPATTGALFAFLVILARELVKDVQDLPGDRRASTRTLPALIGPRATLALVRILLVLTVALTPLPYLTGFMHPAYLVGLVPTDFLLMWLALELEATPRGLARSSRVLKLAALLGMMALAAGRLA